jgi:hypothetical protein
MPKGRSTLYGPIFLNFSRATPFVDKAPMGMMVYQ